MWEDKPASNKQNTGLPTSRPTALTSFVCDEICILRYVVYVTLQWRHNGRDGVSNHQLHDCLLDRLFGRRSKKTSKHCVTGLCAGYSPVTGEFPAQMASNEEKSFHLMTSSWKYYARNDRRANMAVDDGLAHIWRQVICHHHDGFGSAAHWVPNVI